jgi:4-hydroxy-3-methylbut-2-enyl diphosphate reductase
VKVIKITPRGYCYGVVDAMVLAQKAAQKKTLARPIHILGMIVHNRHVVEAFEKEGVITLDGANRMELLEQIDEGTVIFTAHGVSPQVKQRAHEKGLQVLDATCPDVTVTHDLIREKVASGYEIIYIGKHGHPEPEGAIGESPGHVHLVQTENDVDELDLEAERVAVTTQTTMSQWDTADVIERVEEKYPHAEVYNEICLSTQERQEAVAEQAQVADVVIVVGDQRSNNSNRLVQVAEEIAGVPGQLADSVLDIKREWLEGCESVAVTSGASTPTQITREVIEFLEYYEPDRPETFKPEKFRDRELSILPRIHEADR